MIERIARVRKQVLIYTYFQAFLTPSILYRARVTHIGLPCDFGLLILLVICTFDEPIHVSITVCAKPSSDTIPCAIDRRTLMRLKKYFALGELEALKIKLESLVGADAVRCAHIRSVV